MAPIRVGILGLSASSPTGINNAWANVAHLPHLLSSPNFVITALANSSKQSAETTIKTLNLPGNPAAYGTPQEIANDPNVDLVVVSVNVAKHKELVWPAIAAGKDVFVEWPLGANLKEGQEIAAFAKEKGVKVVCGLQARLNPDILKIKELVASGKIGKILSTNLSVAAGMLNNGQLQSRVKYFLTKSVGGNLNTIMFGHVIDSFQYALGPFVTVSSLYANRIPTINLLNPAGEIVEIDVPKDTEDQFLLHGILESGVVASVHLRSGNPPADGNATRWNIYGTEGQIEVTSVSAAPQMSPKTIITLTDKVGKRDVIKVEHKDEEVKQNDGSYSSGPPANVMRLYEAFRKGETGRFASFEEAVDLHLLLQKLEESSKQGKKVEVKL